jgi:RNA-binding protein YhbY
MDTRAHPTTVQIGKRGLTGELLDEIKRQLKRRKTIKIKYLKAALASHGRQALTDAILEQTGAQLLASVGNVVVINRNNFKGKML